MQDHPSGRDAIETSFFGEIDHKGAIVRDQICESASLNLSAEQRSDFARLLLSLEARRPRIINQLRNEVQAYLRQALDSDSEIRSVLSDLGHNTSPSSYIETGIGSSLEDHALTVVQKLVENPKIGVHLINAHWDIKRVRALDGSLILSDRPLIRVHGYDQPGATWMLPLNPQTAFIACNHLSNLKILQNISGQRFVKEANYSSVSQAERFVFCADHSHERWLEKYLKPIR